VKRALDTVGIVSNEFFELGLGRMGGFGWAAQRSAECLVERRDLGYRPFFLAGQQLPVVEHVSGVPLLTFNGDAAGFRAALDRARLGLLLTIDFRPRYAPILEALAEQPLLVWVRDPRPPEDIQKIATLEIPGSPDPPAGVRAIDCSSLGSLVERARDNGRSVVMASPAPSLSAQKAPGTYGTPAVASLELLPNPLDVVPGRMRKSPTPRVLFLGRLDPIKRPWVFVELARRFPGVEFLMLGQSHFEGPGAWQPGRLPANLRLLAHVDGQEKARLLESAWMIVNTSIHEALAISFLEALHTATPIVSCQNPEGVTSRFGAYVGRWDGTGLDGLDAFSEGVGCLLEDRDLRVRLGREGRTWVRSTHTRDRFAGAFARLADGLVHIDD
jgi:glycosyltransferase involved in cell wall biosynthesis